MSTDKEQGFTKVPNELYDALLRKKLSPSQLCTVLYIIRKTYGFHKEEDSISVRKMAEETGYSRQAMINAVRDLEKMGIIKTGYRQAGRPTNMLVTNPELWNAKL